MKKEKKDENRMEYLIILLIIVQYAYGFGIQLPGFIVQIMMFIENTFNPWFQTALFLIYVFPLDFSC